jgi:hypothetical protein
VTNHHAFDIKSWENLVATCNLRVGVQTSMAPKVAGED